MDFKRWYQSRTVRIAILQALVGIVVAFQAEYPAVAAIAIFKSFLDIALRYNTDKPIL